MNEKIKTYSSTITAVFSALVVLYGVFKFVSNGNETTATSKEIKKALTEITSEIEVIKQNQMAGNSRLTSSILDVNIQIQTVRDENRKWHKSYLQFVKDNTKSSEMLFKYLEGLNLDEVKKN